MFMYAFSNFDNINEYYENPKRVDMQALTRGLRVSAEYHQTTVKEWLKNHGAEPLSEACDNLDKLLIRSAVNLLKTGHDNASMTDDDIVRCAFFLKLRGSNFSNAERMKCAEFMTQWYPEYLHTAQYAGLYGNDTTFALLTNDELQELLNWFNCDVEQFEQHYGHIFVDAAFCGNCVLTW